MKSVIILVAGLVMIVCVGTCIYFVGNVSTTFQPIKQYEYNGDFSKLVLILRNYCSRKPNLIFTIDKTVGNKTNGFAQEISIKVKNDSHDLLYELKCQDLNAKKSTSVLKLIGAHDLTNNAGGYGINTSGMRGLLNIFDSKIIDSLNAEKKILKLL